MQTSTVHAERVADCAFSVAQEYVEDYLRAAGRGSDGALLRAGALARRVSVRYDLRADAAEPGRSHDEIVLSWLAKSPLLPDFAGTLRLRIEGERTRLVLDGTYVPPGWFFGAAFDRIAGKHIAAATADDFLRRLAARLTERERALRTTGAG